MKVIENDLQKIERLIKAKTTENVRLAFELTKSVGLDVFAFLTIWSQYPTEIETNAKIWILEDLEKPLEVVLKKCPSCFSIKFPEMHGEDDILNERYQIHFTVDYEINDYRDIVMVKKGAAPSDEPMEIVLVFLKRMLYIKL